MSSANSIDANLKSPQIISYIIMTLLKEQHEEKWYFSEYQYNLHRYTWSIAKISCISWYVQLIVELSNQLIFYMRNVLVMGNITPQIQHLLRNFVEILFFIEDVRKSTKKCVLWAEHKALSITNDKSVCSIIITFSL